MNIITVTQLNTYLKSIVSESEPLKNIYIVGEISNFVHYYKSGHMYFTLKDEKSQIKAVMFSSFAQRLPFKPENGMSVICRGRIGVYEKDSVCQLYAEDMQPEGTGALSIAYEQLKNKLMQEGLFAEDNKKTLPAYPKKIGVVTSDIGAAVEDIKKITARRYPLCELVISPTLVQGDGAPDDIVRSILLLDSMDDIDLIIVGRGGGSLEDLWAFNSEMVARTIYACTKPVISAVGHETDYTICDFVADVRASTPSAAAELAVPDSQKIKEYLSGVKSTLSLLLKRKLEFEYQRYDELASNRLAKSSAALWQGQRKNLFDMQASLLTAYEKLLLSRKNDFSVTAQRISSLNPLSVLTRGYCVAQKEDKTIKSVKDIDNEDLIKLIFYDGSVSCRVE